MTGACRWWLAVRSARPREWFARLIAQLLNLHAFALVPRRVDPLRRSGVLRLRSFHEVVPRKHCGDPPVGESWALALVPNRLQSYGVAFALLGTVWTALYAGFWSGETWYLFAFWLCLLPLVLCALPFIVFWSLAPRYVLDRELGELLSREGRSWLAGVTPRWPWKPRCGAHGCRGPGWLQRTGFWLAWHACGGWWHRGPRLFGPDHPAHVAACIATLSMLDPDRHAPFTRHAFWLWYVCYPVWGIALMVALATILFMPLPARYLIGLGILWFVISVFFAIVERHLMERDTRLDLQKMISFPFSMPASSAGHFVDEMQRYFLNFTIAIAAVLLLMIFQIASQGAPT